MMLLSTLGLGVRALPADAVDAACDGVCAFDGADAAFLDDLQRRCFRYFDEHADADTGLVADRAHTDGTRRGNVASIAATGFGLSALCIADHHGWIDRAAARRRATATLRFIHDKLPHEHGYFYHFVDMKTGRVMWNCEVSSIDTALLMAGVLTAREYFATDPAASELTAHATAIYERVDWPWLLNGGRTLSMGWRPDKGFINARWDHFSEHMMLEIMAMGSRTHPLPAECWDAWKRGPVVTYAGRTFMQCPALFTHQFSHAWVDFREISDKWADYWQNSVDATLAHRQFCIDLSAMDAKKFGCYGPQLWGITASDSADGYRAWGGPPVKNHPIDPALDGTVVPCAAAGSLPFAPKECVQTLRNMHDEFGGRIWGRYGFADAFNPRTQWIDGDVIGIDVGITLLMAENCRTGFIWNWFMKAAEVQRGLIAAGFKAKAKPAISVHHAA